MEVEWIEREEDVYSTMTFYEALTEGNLKAVNRHLSHDSSLLDQPFYLCAISHEFSDFSSCHCWQYFEVGFQLDNLAGFYPGTLGWLSRNYPPLDDDEGRVHPVSISSDFEINRRLKHFFASLKVKEIPDKGQIRICRCRREDSIWLLQDSVSRCRDRNEMETHMNDKRMMNKLGMLYPVHIASMFGHYEVLKLLIAEGADLSVTTKACGLQPIHLTVMYRRLDCLQALLDANVNVNEYAFHTVADSQKPEEHIPFEWRILPISQAIELLLDSYSQPMIVAGTWRREAPLYTFSSRKRKTSELDEWNQIVHDNKDAEMIEAILQAPFGCEVNKVDGPLEEFTYPILRSMPVGAPLVERLLVAGSDPNVNGWGQDAALSISLPEQDLDLVKLLLFYGADPNHQGRRSHVLRPWIVWQCNHNKLMISISHCDPG
jgi:ankyrin repeat protein